MQRRDDDGLWEADERPVDLHGRKAPRRRLLDVGDRDLQQCADSLMRLRATWQREQGVWPSFHATSGDAIGLQRVAGGECPSEKGGKLVWAAQLETFIEADLGTLLAGFAKTVTRDLRRQDLL